MSMEQVLTSERRLYLLYHELRPSGSKYSYVIETNEFEKHLNLFSQRRTQNAGGLWPEITFDDGHISNFEYALPILQSRGLSAQFFITVGWTGQKRGYMGWNELRMLLDAGQSIGAHGWTHTLLTHCNEKELQTELVDARKTLEDKLGVPIETMSLPGGRYNRRVLAACAEAGYTQIYSSIPRSEPVSSGPFMGRLNIRGDMKLEWIAELLKPKSRTLASLGRQYKVKEAAKALLGDRLYETAWALLNRKEPDTDGDGVTANEDSTHHQ
ncbi:MULTISPECIES: polysaccharide deacetylase family protein [Acidobacteriaceae]|uniref:polysaccharide deacetylase family protein n=1 Tax=Acidobacteriaceae TaxID=204434 RepID=UPI00131A775D|nr:MULTISPECIES: polysaccharide deacetylase family protein [Acidobacteriaceae]MDW5267493.1 polysaccharide deacetylase family protein [Edaphobacter sp.]